MAKTKATIRTISGMQSAVGISGSQTITVGRPVENGGDGLGYNGGQVLVLAVGTCFYNDLYDAADERGIKIRSIELEIRSGWAGDPVISSGIEISAKVEAEATTAEIEEMVHHVSTISTISNTVRQGTAVLLGSINAVSITT